MSLAPVDMPADADAAATPVAVLAPRHYQARAVAVFEDAALLLSAILPEARVEHVGASAVPGAYSRGDVALCAVVGRDGLREALGVLGEAGFARRAGAGGHVLDAPDSEVALSVQLVDDDAALAPLVAFRDALRADPVLLARYNAIRIDAAARGAVAYAAAKDEFLRGALAVTA